MIKSRRILPALLVALTVISSSAQVTVMQPLSTFGTNSDGSMRPGDVPFLTASSQLQRGLAYNPTTGHLLVVDRSTNSSVNNDVYVLDGNTGELIRTLDNGGILSGGNASFPMNLIGVADDGAIYVANLSNATDTNSPQFRLYRWADENAIQTFVFPQAPGVADPGNLTDTNSIQKRWGDTMTVRGSGTNTQVLVANRGTLVAIFMPMDETLATFAPIPITTDAGNGSVGLGLTFGAGNTFWGTAGATSNGPLYQMQFDLTSGTATTLRTLPSPVFPGTISPILCVPSSNLLAGITMVSGPDVVRLYDISNPDAPVLQDRKNFVTSDNNNTFSGSLALGTNGVLYALDSDNGIMAFTLVSMPSNPLAPGFFMNPATTVVLVGGSATLNAAADGDAPITYQWMFGTDIIEGATNASLVLTNVQASADGIYSVIASNAVGTATSSNATITVVTTPPNTLLFHEPFDYPDGSAIANHSPWTATTNTTGIVEAGSLTNADLEVSSGNKLAWSSASLSVRYPLGITNNVNTFYFSFLYRVDTLGTSSAIGQWGGFVEGVSGTYFGTKLLIRTNGAGGYHIGVTKGGGTANALWATNELNAGDTTFVVGRYVFNPGTANDTCDIWINPSTSTYGASNAPAASAAWAVAGVTDLANIDRFFFRGGGGNPGKHVADELRAGLEWADVTPKLAATTPPTLAIVHNGANVVVTWPSTYTDYVLEGTVSFSSPVTWSPISHTVDGTNNTATVNAVTGNQFLRLRK